MSIKTAVGQVAMIGGDQHDRPSGILVDERASRSSRWRRRGNLYILVEVSGPAADRDLLSRQLLEVVRNTYFSWQGSVTAGLQQAIREANAFLFRENRTSMPGEQCTAGISAAVLRENDLFLAQAGPAVVYVAHKEQVNRFPDLSPWLDDVPLEEVDAAPLGARLQPTAALFHTQVGPGDVALFVETTLARRLSAQELTDILALTTTGEILSALLEAGGGSNLSALAVRLGEEEAAAVSVPPAPTAPAEGPDLAAELLPESPSAGAGRGGWPSSLQAAGDRLGAGLLTLLRRTLPGQVGPGPLGARPTPERKAAVGKSRPRTEQAEEKPRQKPPRRWGLRLAIALPLLIAAVVLFKVVQHSQAHRAAIAALWQQANQSWLEGKETNDKSVARSRLREAQDYLDRLLVLQPEATEPKNLRLQVDARLDEINQVRRIAQVALLKTYADATKPTRVVVEDRHVFVLDRTGGRVYHHQMASGQQALEPATLDTVLVSKGDQVGDVLVNNLVDMVWISAGGARPQGSLGILESGGGLLEYTPLSDKVTATHVAASDRWQYARLVGSYFGRLYVLDSTASKIWRYLPTPAGYSDAPDDWLKEPADLKGAVDMAIGESIYILSGDGTIRRFTTGQPDAFALDDWDTPPNNPGAIFIRPPDQVKSFYVADRGNSRIVQCSPEGRFQWQFRLPEASGSSNALSAATGLFVDEANRRAFFLSANKLYVAILP